MTLKENLINYKVDDTSVVTFVLEEGTDVFHFNETHVETALEETSVVTDLANAITSGLLVSTVYGSNPLEQLRDSDLLDDYERGSGNFAEYVADTIKENFWDADLLEESTEHYDHKRGFTTLTATLTAPASDVMSNSAEYDSVFRGWTAQVNVGNGQFTFTV